jgi:beta-xylosidase
VIASSRQTDMPDPFLLSADGKYYLYLSTAFADPSPRNVIVLSGTPGHWGPLSEALPKVPSWAIPTSEGAYTWAPYVVHLDGKYVMYFASQLIIHTQYATHCIGVATSASPGGPFVPTDGGPIVCQRPFGGDIDAQLFVDPDGPRGPGHPNYLLWKSDNNNLPGSGPTTIWAAPLSDDGLTLTGNAVAIFQPDQAWEEPVLEAPQMVEAPDGSDWLFFSGGKGFFNPDYAMGAVKCDGPLGGCHDTGVKPLVSSNSQGSGPGEETIFVAGDGSDWMLYSPWHTGEPYALLRPVEAVRIGWTSQGPYVAEAGQFPAAS